MNQPNLLELLNKSREIVAQVGAFITEQARSFNHKKIQWKADNSLVSFVDKEAENLLISGLSSLLPEAEYLAEEAYSHTSIQNSERLWVIDPLDGTTNFIQGLPNYCISVALLEKGTPLLGIVYDVPHKQCYWAIKGGGAFLDSQPLTVSSTNRLADTFLALGFTAEEVHQIQPYAEKLSSFICKTRGWRRLGSAALQMAYVAAGRFDAYLDIQLKPWDIAAGWLLIQEAGGSTNDFAGQPISMESNELFAAGGAYKLLLPFVQPLHTIC